VSALSPIASAGSACLAAGSFVRPRVPRESLSGPSLGSSMRPWAHWGGSLARPGSSTVPGTVLIQSGDAEQHAARVTKTLGGYEASKGTLMGTTRKQNEDRVAAVIVFLGSILAVSACKHSKEREAAATPRSRAPPLASGTTRMGDHVLSSRHIAQNLPDDVRTRRSRG
jgi:hypothetical protein